MRFAIKLAQETFFRKDVMATCIMKGESKQYHSLPEKDRSSRILKIYLYNEWVPRVYMKNKEDWESKWKECWESIGQSCKNLCGQ